jgi:hypothetical protein
LREDFNWSEIEPHRGTWDFRRTDRLVETSARRGLRVLPLLLGTPRWLTRRTFALPPDTRAWARFVARVVGRYGSAGSFWREHPGLDRRLAADWYELWNEPYYPFFSVGGVNPGRYAHLFKAGVAAGRAADPRARFLLQADATYRRADDTKASWLDAMWQREPDLATYVDAVAVHPYSAESPEDTSGSRETRFQRIDDVLAGLRDHGVARPRLWLTEIGWSSCLEDAQCVTVPQQARYLQQMFRLVSRRYAATVDAVFVFALEDGGHVPAPADPQRHYGLRRRDGTHKPAWAVVSRAARAARG